MFFLSRFFEENWPRKNEADEGSGGFKEMVALKEKVNFRESPDIEGREKRRETYREDNEGGRGREHRTELNRKDRDRPTSGLANTQKNRKQGEQK
jgi:hypothetical protein